MKDGITVKQLRDLLNTNKELRDDELVTVTFAGDNARAVTFAMPYQGRLVLDVHPEADPVPEVDYNSIGRNGVTSQYKPA